MRICLWCGYDLTGLSDYHACPECGLEYDPQATVIEVEDSWGSLGLALSMVMIAAAAYAVRLKNMTIFFLVLIGSIGLGWLARRWRTSGRSARLMVGASGITHCRLDGTIRRIPWPDIRKVFQDPITGALVIKKRGRLQSTVRVLSPKGPRHVRKIVRLVHDAKAQYIASRESPPL